MAEGRSAGPTDEGSGSGRKRSLSRESIVEAAIAVTDEHGVEGLTMRSLGRALGVDPMTVYGYFPDKATLFDAVVESEAKRLRSSLGPLPDDPLEAVVTMLDSYRIILLEHPNLAPLVATRPVPQEFWASTIEQRLELMRNVGFHDEDIPLVSNAIGRFCLGRVVFEATEISRMAHLGEDADTRLARLAAHTESLDDEGLARVTAAALARRFGASDLANEYRETIRAMVIGFLLRLGRELPASALPAEG